MADNSESLTSRDDQHLLFRFRNELANGRMGDYISFFPTRMLVVTLLRKAWHTPFKNILRRSKSLIKDDAESPSQEASEGETDHDLILYFASEPNKERLLQFVTQFPSGYLATAILQRLKSKPIGQTVRQIIPFMWSLLGRPTTFFARKKQKLSFRNSEKYRILFSGIFNSSHAYRWVMTVASNPKYELYFFPTFIIPNTLDLFTPKDNVTLCTMPTIIDAILQVQPHIVHTMHTQQAGYPLANILKSRYLQKDWYWIHSLWGSDIYYWRKFKEHQAPLRKTMCNVDMLLTEGERDRKLAEEMGRTGLTISGIPAFGSIVPPKNVTTDIPPSHRKQIAVKGYLAGVGRFLTILTACEMVKDLLKDYVINVFCISGNIDEVLRTFEFDTGLKVQVYKKEPFDKIFAMLARSRAYVGASLSDGLPATLIEAMSMGAFPIQTDTSVADEWIEDGVSGILVKPNDPHTIAAALRRALTEDELVDNAAKINQKTVATRLNPELIKEKILNLYEQAIAIKTMEDHNNEPDSANIKEESPAPCPAPPVDRKNGAAGKPTTAPATAVARKESGDAPLVSIICLAYKHEKFVEQTLQAIISQKTTFSFEALPGDDASPDRTADIIRDYAARHPHIILPELHEKNLGIGPNSRTIAKRIRGRYVCICDCDDFWTDPYKLQKQVDFLEAHPECSMCFHDITITYDDNSQPDEDVNCRLKYPDIFKGRDFLTLQDILWLNPIPSLSAMYRWRLGSNPPDWIYKYSVIDLSYHLLHAAEGNIGYINENMGTYRKHHGGSWQGHGTDAHKKKTLGDYISLLEDANNHLEKRFDNNFAPLIAYLRKDLGELESKSTFDKIKRALRKLIKG